ncbi:hypothetical protein DUR97_05730 [Salmonella enterica subsp. enterica serovar Binza]|nr:hypothetical protein [Salmonella enterica subsp. enterica serovar Binza]EDQ2670332.1 hypothetical protein [Salmonella enterica subsp. enterica serovar Saintpaul]
MNLAYFLFLSITVMLTSFIIKSLVVLVKFKLLRDERLEYTSNKNIDEMYDLMNAKEEILIRNHKQMLALHLSLLIFVLFIAYIY